MRHHREKSMSENFKVLGLPLEQGRWMLVALGLAINLCLGSVYSWSVFRKPLEELFSVGATESGLPFMVFLAFFALLMPIAGRLLQKYGVKKIMILGGVIVGIGWILSSLAPNMAILTVSYGIIAGGGVGIVYGGPIAISTRWFPDKKGLAVGLTIVGFGLSPFITAPLARMLIDLYGALTTFGILGIIFLLLLVILSVPLKMPPVGWKPEGWTSPTASTESADLDSSKMLKTSKFYGLWICYIIGTLTGLMAIGISSPVGQEIIKLDPTTAAMTVSIFAVFNGIGRPLFGWITDRLTPRNSSIMAFIIILIASIGMLNAGESQVLLYMICFAGFWLTLGGWLAIAPTATATFFGTTNYAKNYGIIFTAYGIGAIIGIFMSGRLRDLFGSYILSFYPTAILAVIGIIIASILLRPSKNKP
jgi:OFA family oxalate/formate antiporter-like MFS transporter